MTPLLAFKQSELGTLCLYNCQHEWQEFLHQRFMNDPENPLSNGDFGSTYRCFTGPYENFYMSLCFFNTTPNAYTLALGTAAYPGLKAERWVWSANPNRPVREGSALFLLPDGNLVLYDVDGRVAWQTNTSNMATGYVNLQTRSHDWYGNMVIVNVNDDTPIWQSFEHPSYTLFPNQMLYSSGPDIDKLVSHRSSLGGQYTMMMSNKSLSLYYKGANRPKPLLYYTLFKTSTALNNVKFYAFQNRSTPTLIQNFVNGSQGTYQFGSTPQSDVYTIQTMYLRLESDGNLRIYSLFQDNSEGDFYWDETFKVFTKGGLADMKQESECQLPEKCGNFGICDQDECVACPSPEGLMTPWTDKCMPPKLVGSCSGRIKAKYYKIKGVEHFISKYTRGQRPVAQSMCKKKCSVDCTCLGYFYHKETSECWVVSDLKTLTKSPNPKHLGYIKMTN